MSIVLYELSELLTKSCDSFHYDEAAHHKSTSWIIFSKWLMAKPTVTMELQVGREGVTGKIFITYGKLIKVTLRLCIHFVHLLDECVCMCMCFQPLLKTIIITKLEHIICQPLVWCKYKKYSKESTEYCFTNCEIHI